MSLIGLPGAKSILLPELVVGDCFHAWLTRKGNGVNIEGLLRLVEIHKVEMSRDGKPQLIDCYQSVWLDGQNRGQTIMLGDGFGYDLSITVVGGRSELETLRFFEQHLKL